MSYLITLITQTIINYESQSRSPEVLANMLNGEKLSEMVDLVVFYMSDSFEAAQAAIETSLENYFSKARVYYLLILCIFVSVTSVLAVIIGLVVFHRVKRSILEIQNILVLLPLQTIEPLQRTVIEKFLNT